MDKVFVLVLNAGSSSLKFNLFDMAREASVAEGMAERIISTPDSRVVGTVVPTNEELMIAREAVR